MHACAHRYRHVLYNIIFIFLFGSFLLNIMLQRSILILGASLVAQRLKRLPEMRETWVRSLGQEDPLEKEMATHSSILAWRIPGMGEPSGLLAMGSHRVEHN